MTAACGHRNRFTKTLQFYSYFNFYNIEKVYWRYYKKLKSNPSRRSRLMAGRGALRLGPGFVAAPPTQPLALTRPTRSAAVAANCGIDARRCGRYARLAGRLANFTSLFAL